MNAHFFGFERQIQFVPSATHPIELRCGTLAAHSGASLVKHAG
jgi:hypothetical protein